MSGRVITARAALTAAVALALVIFVGCGGSDEEPSLVLTPEEELSVCQGSREAIDEFARTHPDVPVEEVRSQIEEMCRTGPNIAPVPPEPPALSTSGCGELEPYPGERRRPHGRRTAELPSRPVPFFAPRSGALPPTGTPTVAGIRLPRGSRCTRHWATDESVPDPTKLAARLAAVFPKTGLWPIVWEFPDDDPDAYIQGLSHPDAAARVDVGTVLRKGWPQDFWKRPFPGLAPPSASAGAGVADDPFATLAESWDEVHYPPGDTARALLLVPVNRPADVPSVLGMETTEYLTDEEMTAILRSWEERFGAILTSVGPGTLDLAVDAPPRSRSQALRLAAEQSVFAPEDDLPNSLGKIAGSLLSGKPYPDRSKYFWSFGWPD